MSNWREVGRNEARIPKRDAAIVNAAHLREQVLMMEQEAEVEPKELLSQSSQITGVAKNAALGAHLIKELSKWEEAQNAKKSKDARQQRSHAVRSTESVHRS